VRHAAEANNAWIRADGIYSIPAHFSTCHLSFDGTYAATDPEGISAPGRAEETISFSQKMHNVHFL
jgi:hypothetical protein